MKKLIALTALFASLSLAQLRETVVWQVFDKDGQTCRQAFASSPNNDTEDSCQTWFTYLYFKDHRLAYAIHRSTSYGIVTWIVYYSSNDPFKLGEFDKLRAAKEFLFEYEKKLESDAAKVKVERDK